MRTRFQLIGVVLAIGALGMLSVAGCNNKSSSSSPNTNAKDVKTDTAGTPDATSDTYTAPQTDTYVAPQMDTYTGPTTDATTSDADASGPSSYYCFDMISCVNTCATNATSQSDFSSCEQTSCFDNAVTANEATLFNSWYSCLGSCANSQGKIDFSCAETSCLAQDAACDAGQTNSTGASTCANINTCLNACASGSYQCYRSCYAAGSETGLEQLSAVNFCILNACVSSTTAQFQACAQTATTSGGACMTEVTTCQTGQAPQTDASNGSDATYQGDTSTDVGPQQ